MKPADNKKTVLDDDSVKQVFQEHKKKKNMRKCD